MKNIKQILTSTLALLITFSVILASAHVKDIAAQSTALKVKAPVAKLRSDDLVKKVISDLHNHVDKTMFKAFAKVFGDQGTHANERQARTVRTRLSRSFSLALMEAMLMFRLVYARALAS